MKRTVLSNRLLVLIYLTLLPVSIAVFSGCEPDPGIEARYAVEKRIWKARMIEQRIWQEPLHVNYRAADAAIAAYEEILAANPPGGKDTATWSDRIRVDVERLRLSCEIALTKLYFIQLQDNAGVTYFKPGFRQRDLLCEDRRDLDLSLVKSLYRGFERDPLEAKCASLIADVLDNYELWSRGAEIGDTLLSVPVYLVGVELERGTEHSVPESAELAEQFLGRVIETWPDSLIAQKARLSRADLYVMLERYEKALEDIDAALAARHSDTRPDEIVLFRGEILAHGLKRYEEAESLFISVRSGNPVSPVAQTAALDLASVEIKTGRMPEGIEILRRLELAADTPAETQATAMFMRAMCLHDEGQRDEALHILWRICRLQLFTRISIATPLVILRHQLETRDREKTESVHQKVVDFYLSVIRKDSASLRSRGVLQDYLIESYLLMGDPRGAAKVLEERAPEWGSDNGSVGFVKSAMIYLNLLDDRENGVRVLKKCLDLFPQSRYLVVITRTLGHGILPTAGPVKG